MCLIKYLAVSRSRRPVLRSEAVSFEGSAKTCLYALRLKTLMAVSA
jgi:hypothetical protein